MPRPVWTGAITFGMVAIPVKLIPSVNRKSVSFNQLDEQTMSRIRYRKVAEATGEEVPSDRIVKGVDTGGGEYVIVKDSDLEPLAPTKSKQLELEVFVPTEQLDPVAFDTSYYVLPDKNTKPYVLLAQALDGTGRVGIGRFVMRQKEYLAALRSIDGHLVLSTLVFPDEIVPSASVEEFEQLASVELSSKEVNMARSLVEAMSDDFKPADFQDDYRVAVESLIDELMAGRRVITAVSSTGPSAAVIDLAEALQQSLKAATEAKGRHPSSGLDASSEAKSSDAKSEATPKRRATRKSA